jgi:hypothetical protein
MRFWAKKEDYNSVTSEQHMYFESGLPLATDTFTDTILSLLCDRKKYISDKR